MINMPHCRVRNTLAALRECCETLEYSEDLSEAEQKALDQLLQLCKKMSCFYATDHDRQNLHEMRTETARD